MAVTPGSLVAVQGLGGLGHLAIQYANKFGYRVVALSRDSQKEKFARDLGAHEYIDGSKVDQGEALQKLGGASLIVVTAPNPKVISPLMKGLGIMGKLLILAGRFWSIGHHCTRLTAGIAAGEVPVDTGAMVRHRQS
jgi:D-arabinose 1-dehydrogenase-like Zn-dependent alcohol dehydrogenase